MQVDLNQVLTILVKPIVEFKDKLRIEVDDSAEDTIHCTIHVAKTDTGRLIGRRGNVAEDLQQVIRSFCRIPNKKILISVVEN